MWGIYKFGDMVIDPKKYPWGKSISLRLIEPLSFGGNITASDVPNEGSIEDVLDNNGDTYLYYSINSSTWIERDFSQDVYIEKIRAQFGTSVTDTVLSIEVKKEGGSWITVASAFGDDWRDAPSPWFTLQDNYRYARMVKSGSGWHDYRILNVWGYV